MLYMRMYSTIVKRNISENLTSGHLRMWLLCSSEGMYPLLSHLGCCLHDHPLMSNTQWQNFKSESTVSSHGYLAPILKYTNSLTVHTLTAKQKQPLASLPILTRKCSSTPNVLTGLCLLFLVLGVQGHQYTACHTTQLKTLFCSIL